MIIGIVGSRRRDEQVDYDAVEKAFLSLYKVGDKKISIVSGGCPKGGDRFAELIAIKYGLTLKIYPAEWDKYGKRAGFIRNEYIAQDADILIACVSKDRTGGTENTIEYFKRIHPDKVLMLV